MKAVIICIMGLVGAQGHVGAERLVEGQVLLASGQPAIGAQVRFFYDTYRYHSWWDGCFRLDSRRLYDVDGSGIEWRCRGGALFL